MRIGIQTGWMGEQFGIDESFRMIKEAGFESVDFDLDNLVTHEAILTGRWNELLDKSEDEYLLAAKPYLDAAKKYGIAIGQTHAAFNLHFDGDRFTDAQMVDHAKKCIMVTAAAGCSHIIVHPAFNGYDRKLDQDEEWKLNIRLYSELIPTLKKYDVICCLENMFTGKKNKIYAAICSDAQEACDYIDELNDIAGEKRFAFCYDTGHGLLTGHDVYTDILRLGERIEKLHIHDNNGIWDQHIAPYMGILDWNRFVRALKEIEYRGDLSLETYNAVGQFPSETAPQLLKLMAAEGRLFAKRIEE